MNTGGYEKYSASVLKEVINIHITGNIKKTSAKISKQTVINF
jgi:hypothetical protein